MPSRRSIVRADRAEVQAMARMRARGRVRPVTALTPREIQEVREAAWRAYRVLTKGKADHVRRLLTTKGQAPELAALEGRLLQVANARDEDLLPAGDAPLTIDLVGADEVLRAVRASLNQEWERYDIGRGCQALGRRDARVTEGIAHLYDYFGTWRTADCIPGVRRKESVEGTVYEFHIPVSAWEMFGALVSAQTDIGLTAGFQVFVDTNEYQVSAALSADGEYVSVRIGGQWYLNADHGSAFAAYHFSVARCLSHDDGSFLAPDVLQRATQAGGQLEHVGGMQSNGMSERMRFQCPRFNLLMMGLREVQLLDRQHRLNRYQPTSEARENITRAWSETDAQRRAEILLPHALPAGGEIFELVERILTIERLDDDVHLLALDDIGTEWAVTAPRFVGEYRIRLEHCLTEVRMARGDDTFVVCYSRAGQPILSGTQGVRWGTDRMQGDVTSLVALWPELSAAWQDQMMSYLPILSPLRRALKRGIRALRRAYRRGEATAPVAAATDGAAPRRQ